MNMRIGIDARPFKYREFSGIPATIYEIMCIWMRQNPEHEYYLISNTLVQLPCGLPDNWHIVVQSVRCRNGTLWMFLELPQIVKSLQLDVYWGTNYLLPQRVKGCRYVLTVYDLSFERYPYVSSRKTRFILKTFCKKACKIADAIFTISQSSAADIVELYGIAAEKVHTVYLGAPARRERKDLSAGEIASGTTRSRYFLFLSTIEPRKNPLLVLKAYEQYCKNYGTEIQLVFAGKHGWNVEDFDQYLEAHPYRQNIQMLGYIRSEEKEQLLENAEALVYPSVYEGFGLPILEAMNYGIPVITSDNSSMPEVGGDAALYIHDITSEDELCQLMRQVSTMSLAERTQLQERMMRNLDRFRWDECAEKVMGILKGE